MNVQGNLISFKLPMIEKKNCLEDKQGEQEE